jgi:hypothetical protein
MTLGTSHFEPPNAGNIPIHETCPGCIAAPYAPNQGTSALCQHISRWQIKTQPGSISKVAPVTHVPWAQRPQAFLYCGFMHTAITLRLHAGACRQAPGRITLQLPWQRHARAAPKSCRCLAAPATCCLQGLPYAAFRHNFQCSCHCTSAACCRPLRRTFGRAALTILYASKKLPACIVEDTDLIRSN